MANELTITFEPTNIIVGTEKLYFEVDFPVENAINSEKITVPTSVFANDSGLRAIVRYLHDKEKMSFAKISTELHKHINTIRTSYVNSKPINETYGRLLPINIFSKLPPLEAAAFYLKNEGLALKTIATTLNRDPRTIWTVLDRADRRLGK